MAENTNQNPTGNPVSSRMPSGGQGGFGGGQVGGLEIVIEQDADILGKIYPNSPQHIKLNNEVGMDWVRRNFDSFPKVMEPNFSR